MKEFSGVSIYTRLLFTHKMLHYLPLNLRRKRTTTRITTPSEMKISVEVSIQTLE
jgi:hypothetical protein